ncbi:hypothetical protein [Sulfuritalea sp.]|uniref:hypothetical protein n=1 Tax=Sulfuritalea sp. TaxID=2480090 RepID=UPI00286D8F67|nr:hypothetical protein [Sulfuritalea sp.]
MKTYLQVITPISFIIVLTGAIVTSPAMAADRGEGGCSITPNAPIYSNSKSNDVVGTVDVGDCVAGITMLGWGMGATEPRFDQEYGRVHVAFLPDKNSNAYQRQGWMNPGDLTRFTYECGCGGTRRTGETCSPFASQGILNIVFNTCFKEARDKKKAEMLNQGTVTPASTSKSNGNAKRAETALRNDDILSLVKVGLDDKLIISKIQAAEATDFDLSTEGIVALKTTGVSNAVINTMMNRADKKR